MNLQVQYSHLQIIRGPTTDTYIKCDATRATGALHRIMGKVQFCQPGAKRLDIFLSVGR